ncbi:MAG TPA: hypothetical protein VFK22_09095 [Candidatus Dormibacteraeota bacterium]|nr:hypothetical protein [Candidatus Dormibacteraeota bacterium]
MRRTVIGSFVGGLAALIVGATPALAAPGYSLFGDATLTTGHNSPTGVQIRSIGGGFGGIFFPLPAGTTFADLQSLGTDFMVTQGDCGTGAPRFSINFTSTTNAFVYLGPAPNFSGCTLDTWSSSGNLLSGTNTIDTSQLGGTFYDSFAHAYSTYGSMPITGIDLVVDAGAFVTGGTQTVVVDNVNINGTVFTFESAQTCKDNGWQAYGTTFKNQGDCVSFFATGGSNLPG